MGLLSHGTWSCWFRLAAVVTDFRFSTRALLGIERPAGVLDSQHMAPPKNLTEKNVRRKESSFINHTQLIPSVWKAMIIP